MIIEYSVIFVYVYICKADIANKLLEDRMKDGYDSSCSSYASQSYQNNQFGDPFDNQINRQNSFRTNLAIRLELRNQQNELQNQNEMLKCQLELKQFVQNQNEIIDQTEL